MILIALTTQATHLAVCGARRAGSKLWTFPPWEWAWALWHRWSWLKLSKITATDGFTPSLLTPSLAIAIILVTRCMGTVILHQIPKIILLPLLWSSPMAMKFSKSLWLMGGVLLLLGCDMGIPTPAASAFTMKTSSMVCLAIPAVASTAWDYQDDASREAMASRPATKYSACTVEIYNVPEMKRQEVFLDTGAARTAMPVENLWHSIRKHGTRALKILHRISATGAVHSASNETTLKFRFTIVGPTHKMHTLIGGVGSLPMLGANFWGKAGACIDFPSWTVK